MSVASASRLNSTMIAVVNDPYTTLTCDSVRKVPHQHATEQHDAVACDGLKTARYERDEQHTDTQRQAKQIRQNRRQQKVPAPDRHAMHEDDRQRILQYC